MAADADHVLGLPEVRLRSGDLEFLGCRARAVPDFLGECVHALDERFGIALRMGAIGGPFLDHVAAIEEHAGRAILIDILGAEILREQSEPALAP
jgi:hypothetical protein